MPSWLVFCFFVRFPASIETTALVLGLETRGCSGLVVLAAGLTLALVLREACVARTRCVRGLMLVSRAGGWECGFSSSFFVFDAALSWAGLGL